MWLLKQRRRSQIFQGLSVQEVVTDLLKEADVTVQWALVKEYPRRAYLTQYQETDWAFLTLTAQDPDGRFR